MPPSKSGDNLPAHVNAKVDITLGEEGSQMLDMLTEIQSTISDVAIQRKKLNKLGYDITFETNQDGELIVELDDLNNN